MMRHGLDASLDHSLNDAALAVMIANPSEDVREGVKAFFEKRTPEFKGR
jgi:enoyl-CoA hydratase/carnithine racemase